ncbi:flagellar transcriptional regulator FlhD [Methylomonas sp. UP202]|uniref:flagellar transcriptional regulator FlhD n=1 Tax=Methylomonas sp. UP202 TaxID=3040943 RepID=UPI0024795CCE|nr:flagellar transcriptional regulator FlhD [Methylomonas sp. UP202]WGS88672.1 flagellar transcriptional regulator FlhD [Methylomonas sp. UP202]
MTDAIEAFNLKLLLYIRELILNDQSSKLQILMGVDTDTANLIKSISIDDIIALSKTGFLLFIPRFESDQLKRMLGPNHQDPSIILEFLNKNG